MVTHMYVVNIGARKFDQLAKRSVLARGDFGDYESDSRSSISAVSYGSRDGFSGGPGRSSASGQSGKAIVGNEGSGETSFEKYDVDVSVSEGKHTVEVPSEIIEKANPLWEDFVIARFLETTPHIAKVHMILNKIWTFGDKSQKLEVYEVDAITMRIRITSAMVREKVVKRGCGILQGFLW